ncbi:amidohydrolase [Kaistia algarum]|uniref:amidohydrolase family protein n=1 Tax=Kaistia algarum TaxID=2083279 RepID=UPI000CE82D17|nr:amidohydrolase [Kaistia algarum]MCX5514373.1 amidohydrolase [Kaistia algarum]PPE79121.1 amidohydrolase [Kaistia algarum]
MSIFIRNATLLTLDGPDGTEPFTGSVLIEGDQIAAIGPDLVAPEGAEIIEGRGRLVMPGLVNSHFHSSETFFKGRYEHMPLEIWMLYAYPILSNGRIPERLLYLRTLIGAMESLKGGVTTMVDDFFDPPFQDFERHKLVFDAYEDAGIRARISNNVMDKHVLDTMPFLRELVPAELQAEIGGPEVTIASHEEYCKAAFADLHGRAGRLYFMVSASAPQRVTPELMQASSELALRYNSPLHTHILETKTQAVTGDEFYGKTLIRYMHDIGVLKSNVTIAHSVWVTDDDMALMGDAGVSIAHNCISNQKLSAGIAPIRRLIDAGVNVGLGTDGMCSNDTARIFDVMRAAGLIHAVATPEYTRLVSSREILKAATIVGARTALLDQVTGSLTVGKKADLLVLKMSGFNWTPLNDICHHLVYCENGSSIETVMVAGNIVVQDGKLTTIDEDAILEEVHELVPAWLAQHAEVEKRNQVFRPYFAEMHRRATLRDIGINRYQGDLPLWQGQNRPTV